MRFNGVLLDIDDTLYDYQSAHGRALGEVVDRLSIQLTMDGARIRNAFATARRTIHVELRDTASSHNRLLYFQRMFELLEINPLVYALDTYNLYWEVFLDHIEPFAGVCNFLEKIKNRKVCLVSDQSADIAYRKIKKLTLGHCATHLVTSEEAGKEKPHPYIFLLALQKLRLKAEEVCMIGDSYEKDIWGATTLGMRAFWLNAGGKRELLNNLTTAFSNFADLAEHF